MTLVAERLGNYGREQQIGVNAGFLLPAVAHILISFGFDRAEMESDFPTIKN